MGRARTSDEQQQRSYSDEEIAAAIVAALLAGASAAAIASLLALAAPALEAAAAEFLAALIIRRVPRPPAGTQWGVVSSVYEQNLAYRAHFAIRSAGRLAAGHSSEEREQRFYEQHLAAETARAKSARMAEAAADRFGPVLGWYHTATARTHRPSHIAADGANFDVRYPPASTGGLPGTLPHCDCVAVAPYPAARMLR